MRFIITARPGDETKPADPNAPLDEKLFSDYMRFNAGSPLPTSGRRGAGRFPTPR
jgi:hypothetical protein